MHPKPPWPGHETRQSGPSQSTLWDAPEVVLVLGPDGHILAANDAATQTYGYAEEEIRSLSLRDLRAPDCRSDLPQQLAQAQSGSITYETRHQRRDGTIFPVAVHTAGTRLDGRPVLIHTVRDLSARRRRQNVQALLRDLDRRLLSGDAVDETLSFASAQIADLYGSPLVWFGRQDPDGSVGIWARAGEAAPVLDRISLRWNGTPPGRDSTGGGLHTGSVQKGEVAANPDLAPWREILNVHGIRTYLALPLGSPDEPLGMLLLFGAAPLPWSPDQLEELAEFAGQLSRSLRALRQRDTIRLQTAALEAAANAVMITDREGRIQWVNPAFTRLTGYTAAEALGRTPAFLKSGRHSPDFYQRMWETILAGQVWQGEMLNRRKDGSLYTEAMTITPVHGDDGSISHYIAIKHDAIERQRYEEELRHLALHDSLTGLPNRQFLENRLREMAGKNPPETGTLLYLDIDNFKLINDSLGPLAGDLVLNKLGLLLRQHLPPGSLLARVGGDEFGILIPTSDSSTAREQAEELRRAVDEFRVQIKGHTFDPSVSIGMAPVDGTLSPQRVLVLADAALHAAKERGKNRVVIYSPQQEVEEQVTRDSQCVARIKDALREGRLTLHYQPVVWLDSGSVLHYEALVRMRGSGDKLILPGTFLPTAERFGLVTQIDWWVVEQVLGTLSRHPEMRIFVNLSGHSLGDQSLLEFIEHEVRRRRLAPGQLGFEITETAAVTDLTRAQWWISRLRHLGCRFALDDFGEGFSSFAYLRTLPVDFVKIDGSYIRNLDTDPVNQALVQAGNTVAHALGKKVIAEWVESQPVAGILQQLGVECGQGFLWQAPTPTIRQVSRLQKDR